MIDPRLKQRLQRLDAGELERRRSELEERLTELRASFMQLRAGGCVLEGLIEEVDAERLAIEAILCGPHPEP
jgi:hypothetical protein